MAEEMEVEDYPTEIEEQLTGFESSVGSVSEMLKQMMAVPRSDLSQKLDPLEQAKLDLMSAYTLNSLFWMYLVTQGVNPREHSVKQELERIRTYMNRVKDITDRKKAARLNKGAASRFVRNALYDAEEREPGKAAPAAKKAAHTPGRAPQLKRPKKR